MNLEEKITALVKDELSIGIIGLHDNLVTIYRADAEDMLHIIDRIEREYNVEFNDSEHMNIRSIADMIKILKLKINELESKKIA